jgi:hypothetical protein
MTTRTPTLVLIRHFLRRFLENDLISPDSDRAQLLAIIGAASFSSTLFITMIMSCLKYVVGYYTPGQAAVASLDDKFFYIGLSMVVAALLAVLQWDALVVDARDVAILESLPLRPLAVRRAKLAAVALLGTAAALVLNLVPTVMFPLLMLVKQRVSLTSALGIIAVHGLVTMTAAAFGFVTVIAVRESLAAVLGRRLFARGSGVLQGVLIVAIGSMLLLLPGAASRVERRALATSTALSPPAWFLGAYEVVVGDIVASAPRRRLTPRQINADVKATASYRSHARQFEQLAQVAISAVAFVFAVAAAAYGWNAHRLPQLAPPPIAVRFRRREWLRHLTDYAISRDGTVRAGFRFTQAVLWRSNAHRLTLASCAAAAMAIDIIAVSALDLSRVATDGRGLSRLLFVQPVLYGLLLLGFRHVIRVPAELRANWGFQVAWRDRERQFLAGARAAAILTLVLPAVAVVFPLVAYVVGARAALMHAVLGLAGAMAMLEVLLVSYTKVPFTCSYVPSENMKALAPLYLLVFLSGAGTFAGMERTALGSTGSAVRLLVLLAIVLVAARIVSRRPRPTPVDFNEAPEMTQRLGLHT